MIAPLLGGFLAGYYADGEFRGGIETGILMTIFMIIPGLLLGGFVATSTFVITLVIVAHTAILGYWLDYRGCSGGKKSSMMSLSLR